MKRDPNQARRDRQLQPIQTELTLLHSTVVDSSVALDGAAQGKAG